MSVSKCYLMCFNHHSLDFTFKTTVMTSVTCPNSHNLLKFRALLDSRVLVKLQYIPSSQYYLVFGFLFCFLVDFSFFGGPHHASYRTLFPQPGISLPLAVRMPTPNYQTAREFPTSFLITVITKFMKSFPSFQLQVISHSSKFL